MYGIGEGTFVVRYMGASLLDSRIVYTHEMVPWIISEILRFSEDEQVILQIRNSVVSVFSTKEFHNRRLFELPIWDCVRHFQVSTVTSSSSPPDPTLYFGLIVKSSNMYHHIRLFSGKPGQVAEIISTITEASKVAEPAKSVAKGPTPLDASDTISFEVLYLGKLRMSYKKAPISFIDDALEKFRAHESGRGSQEKNDRDRSSSQESKSDTASVAILLRKLEGIDEPDRKVQSNPTLVLTRDEGRRELVVPKAPFPHPLDDVTYTNGERYRNSSGDSCLVKSLSLPVEPMRSRALSTGHDPRAQVLEASKMSTSSTSGNRTMILIIANREVRIISPDAKTILFHKSIQEISQTAKGMQNKDCFGFICREIGASGSIYVGFIFRCESDKVSSEILQTLKRVAAAEGIPKKSQLYCDHCPMIWYHHLCVDVDGLSDDRAKQMILKRIDELSDEESQNILQKFQGAETQSTEEQIELMMMLIRAHCESKQLNHVHDTPENRHEFLQSYLGGGAIFMKAKRTLTSSLDQFMKRKEQKGGTLPKGFNALLPHHVIHQGREMSPTDDHLAPLHQSDMTYSESPLESDTFRKRSSTLGSIASEKILSELKNTRRGSQLGTSPTIPDKGFGTPQRPTTPSESIQNQHSPMMNIFLKVGPQQSKSVNSSGSKLSHRKGSWRQAIFKRVVSPSSGQTTIVSSPVTGYPSTPPSSTSKGAYRPKKSQDDVRDLWKSAIKQQILLNRMERQNCMLKTKQEEANLKRNKLAYEDMCGSGDCENLGIDAMTAKAESGGLCDMSFFRVVCITGIPKHRRGQVWQLFLQQYMLRAREEADANSGATRMNCIPAPSSSYEQLLRQLTSHQHAILIDLGRTFPNHPYFSSPLGSGQLALFNLLKAYSLLDPDVGYCQGLSFVAGLLLMHLEEDEAFNVLKCFMFEMGAREYYQPDMSGLQLKLYQLNRLIYDQDPDIHLLLYHNDVLPSLYAAPWFLTMFASQFPIGFSVRVMDLAVVQGPDVMVKFALLLIQDHKKQLMECCGLEQIMECFKNVVTQITPSKVDEYVRKAFDMRIDRQMLVYGIEYSVMHDETFLAYLADPRYQKLSKLKPGRSRGSFDESQERDSPTPSSQGSDEDIMDNNNLDHAQQDVQALTAYVASLEAKLRTLGEIPVRPTPVAKVFERTTVVTLEPPPPIRVPKSSPSGGGDEVSSCQT